MKSTFNISSAIESEQKKFNLKVLNFTEEIIDALRFNDKAEKGVVDSMGQKIEEKKKSFSYDKNGFVNKVCLSERFHGRPRTIELSPFTNGSFDVLLSDEDSSQPKEFNEPSTEAFWLKQKNGALVAMLDFFNVE